MDVEESVRLVRSALAGDERARSRLVKVFTPVIQARVAWTLGSRRKVREDIEDRTQEVLLKLFRNDKPVLASWQPDQPGRPERRLSLENFVGMVAKFQTISYLRIASHDPRKEEPTPIDELDVPNVDPDPVRIVTAKEQLELLLARLREILSPLGREMFELLYIHELTVEETMEVSELSAEAVYAWRSRLRKLARELLNDLSGTTAPPRTPPEEEE
jgi:RNA polymerase sigma-70 factor (ECF subfamily)